MKRLNSKDRIETYKKGGIQQKLKVIFVIRIVKKTKTKKTILIIPGDAQKLISLIVYYLCS